MLDIREIEYWISRYENEADKLDQCVTLSALYSIRDKMIGKDPASQQTAAYAEAAAPAERRDALGEYGGSDFLQAVSGKDPASAWSVMDELMDTLQVVNPRAYESVIRKLRKL